MENGRTKCTKKCWEFVSIKSLNCWIGRSSKSFSTDSGSVLTAQLRGFIFYHGFICVFNFLFIIFSQFSKGDYKFIEPTLMSNPANYSPYNKTYKFIMFQNQAYH